MADKTTPLNDEHLNLKALMASFAGWNMPIHYGSIIEEARHTRSAASIFDISHMGEFFIEEDPEDCSFDKAITVPVIKMETGTCRYGFLLNDNGGVIDDLIVYRIASGKWMIVVNASNESKDAEIIKGRLTGPARFYNRSAEIVKIDVQGPASPEAVAEVAGKAVRELSYFTFGEFELDGGESIISRTGYTGEPGYEVYIEASGGAELWNALLKIKKVKPAGLGARDILRLEAGLPLYGHEFTEESTPLEGRMERFIDFQKEFTGRDALLKQKKAGINRRLCGFIADGRRTPRPGNTIYAAGSDAGTVTSGVFSPHINRGIGLGYVKTGYAESGKKIDIDTGRGMIKAEIAKMPLIKKQ